MWSDNIKLWIVLTIFHTGESQYAEYYGNPGDIMFPGPIQSSYNQKINYNPQLPARTNCQSANLQLTIAKELKDIETVEDFIRFMSSKPGTGRELLLSKRFGDENERSSTVIETKPAKCKPIITVVPFRNENTAPSVSYWPSCTHIDRCDGCCNTEFWSCQPVNKTSLNHKVFKFHVTETGEFNFQGEEIIPLEKHTSCQCLCRVKAEHCSIKQRYLEDSCKCECINTDEMEKCNNDPSTKIWNPDRCECDCRSITECNSKHDFNPQTCRCDTMMEQ
ncbi:hypothetical protein PV327_004425 [Microctonus hyperodae]|uniref:Platelet-derived growth factor (PDGF) family profile domain-containing protein n=2 Tax=Microctonus hyperodae TaxID=165561 RepID=A0AA39KMM8_MICHY|nr:hypothetical protein PV327_004425 [Microctonus hyperodae]